MKTQGKVWIIYDAENKSQSKPLSVVQAQVVLLAIQPHILGRFFIWTPGWEDWVSAKDYLESDQKYFVPSQPPRPMDVHKNEKTVAISDENTITAVLNAAEAAEDPDDPFTFVVENEAPYRQEQINYGYYYDDFHAHDLDLSKIRKIQPPGTKKKKDAQPPAKADRRKDERHAFKIEVVLVSDSASFRSVSKNISVSGTMLEKEIPGSFLKRAFDLIIVNPFETDSSKSRLLFRAKIVGDLTDPRRLMFIEQDTEMTQRLEALLKAYVAYQAQMKKSAG